MPNNPMQRQTQNCGCGAANGEPEAWGQVDAKKGIVAPIVLHRPLAIKGNVAWAHWHN